jgi:copper chaperone CopZ
MEALKFKTTIKCSGCVAQATPFLDQAAGEDNWEVDIQNPDKVLTIESNRGVSEQAIVKAVQDAGYKAERVN